MEPVNHGQAIELCINTIAYTLEREGEDFRKVYALYAREIVNNFKRPLTERDKGLKIRLLVVDS